MEITKQLSQQVNIVSNFCFDKKKNSETAHKPFVSFIFNHHIRICTSASRVNVFTRTSVPCEQLSVWWSVEWSTKICWTNTFINKQACFAGPAIQQQQQQMRNTFSAVEQDTACDRERSEGLWCHNFSHWKWVHKHQSNAGPKLQKKWSASCQSASVFVCVFGRNLFSLFSCTKPKHVEIPLPTQSTHHTVWTSVFKSAEW